MDLDDLVFGLLGLLWGLLWARLALREVMRTRAMVWLEQEPVLDDEPEDPAPGASAAAKVP